MKDDFKIKVPSFLDTDNQSIWVLFAFIRKTYFSHRLPVQEGLNFWTSDIIRILDSEDKDIGKSLYPHILNGAVSIGKISNRRVCFFTKGIVNVDVRELTDPRAIRTWCYLMGCLNHNLIANSTDKYINRQALHTIDREYFPLTNRKKDD